MTEQQARHSTTWRQTVDVAMTIGAPKILKANIPVIFSRLRRAVVVMAATAAKNNRIEKAADFHPLKRSMLNKQIRLKMKGTTAGT